MSKNLNKASQWIQRQIDEMGQERDRLLKEGEEKTNKAYEIARQIAELEEVLDKIPSEKSGINAIETHKA
jgi:transaldolase